MALWNLNNKSILIIDDFAQMRSMLFSMLKNYAPKDVVQAANGAQAIEKMSGKKFDIVLCDYNLGAGKDGQQVLEEAKYQKILPFYTLFIMVTAENTNSMVMGAAEYMPDAYLTKPINKNVLISRIQKLLLKKEMLYPLSDAIDNDDSEKTIECCNILLDENIKFKFEILKIKCEHLLKLERYQEALTISQSILNDREIPWAMSIVGQVNFHSKNFEEAESKFKKIIEIDKKFMPAYDWLAKSLKHTDHFNEAQNILMKAVEISPKSVLRQRSLAQAAEKNNDLKQLEITRKKIIEVAKTSCLKSSNDYTELASLYINNGSNAKAVDLLNQTTREFNKDEQIVLDSTIKLSTAYKKLNQNEKYQSSVNSSIKLAANNQTLLHGESALELARACMDLGKTDESHAIIKSVVKEFSDDKNIMDSINSIFEEAGISEEGKKIIALAKSEVIELNNKGVKLIKDDKINEAIKLFEIAVKEMPGNITVNINTATAHLLHLQKYGFEVNHLDSVHKYTNIVLLKDKRNTKALELKEKLQKIKP